MRPAKISSEMRACLGRLRLTNRDDGLLLDGESAGVEESAEDADRVTVGQAQCGTTRRRGPARQVDGVDRTTARSGDDEP